jgi:2-amino-4-hydroxy-6-hydroxymethyldihydropteridine diphosphokinase
MTLSYIALGSNLGDPVQHITTATRELGQLADCQLVACSPWYNSAAVGPGTQPDYINAVVALETTLPALSLLQALQKIENAHGRQRRERWGARTLDVDILLYGDQTLDTDELIIPHPRLAERNFVLYPLFDLAPELTLPCGTPIASLLARCPRAGLRRCLRHDQET